MLGRAARLAVAGALWIVPPAVLPLPSRSGPEGPPQPYGAEPRFGPTPPGTSASLERAQNRALLEGPFPTGGLRLGISDGKLFQDSDGAAREAAFALARASGAAVARISVDWRSIAPVAPTGSFDARDPGSPGYDFAPLDAAVSSASAAGLEPLLVVSHAPAFAEAPGRWPYAYEGSWAPDPTALEAFAVALASRYDGSYPNPAQAGSTLPRVRLWQAWNEPNLARYLEPQWIVRDERWVAFSPLAYRALLDAFYRGVKSVAPDDVVAAAGLAPDGDRAGVGRMAPVTFLRALLCVAEGPHGAPRRARGCEGTADLDALAFHPLSVGNPDGVAPSELDVSVADAAKISSLAQAAVRLGTVAPARSKPLWVTELNWESAPAAAGGVPPAKQAAWLSRALHRLWSAGVGLVAWQFLIDPWPALSAAGPAGGLISYQRPAGLYSPGPRDDPALARPKGFVTAFRLPFDALRADRRHVRVWGLAKAGERVELLGARPSGPWRMLGHLRAGSDGVVDALIELRGRLLLRLRAGQTLSAPEPVGARRTLVLRPR